MKSTVSVRGQVVIPKPLRDRLGIRAGQILDFREERGRLVADKAEVTDPVTRLYGLLRRPGSSDDLVRRLRGDVDGLGPTK